MFSSSLPANCTLIKRGEGLRSIINHTERKKKPLHIVFYRLLLAARKKKKKQCVIIHYIEHIIEK
jgi:hypothetical protein